MTVRVVVALLVVLPWTISAYAHEPTPERDFWCGKQFVTFFVEGTVEEGDDDEDKPSESHMVMTVRKSDVQWVSLNHTGAAASVCDSSFGENLCLSTAYRIPSAFYKMIVACLD